jgi:hypothetical protein
MYRDYCESNGDRVSPRSRLDRAPCKREEDQNFWGKKEEKFAPEKSAATNTIHVSLVSPPLN